MLPRHAVLVAMLVLPLAACAEPSRLTANAEHATRRPHETVNPTVFPSKTPSPTAGATGDTSLPTAPTSAVPANPNAVDALSANQFSPKSTTIKVGTEVTWTNKGGFHTVTGGEPGKPDKSLVNGTLASDGATYKVKFTKPGIYKYFCEPHASLGMIGEVVVQ